MFRDEIISLAFSSECTSPKVNMVPGIVNISSKGANSWYREWKDLSDLVRFARVLLHDERPGLGCRV